MACAAALLQRFCGMRASPNSTTFFSGGSAGMAAAGGAAAIWPRVACWRREAGSLKWRAAEIWHRPRAAVQLVCRAAASCGGVAGASYSLAMRAPIIVASIAALISACRGQRKAEPAREHLGGLALV